MGRPRRLVSRRLLMVLQGTDELSVTVAPDELELDIVWRQSGAHRLSLALRMVVMWLIERNGAKEHLRGGTASQAIRHMLALFSEHPDV